jgi:hypothetical protein
MDRLPGSAYRYAPDGLVGKALDELITRAYAEVADAPVPTSALLDGSAAEQRRRRRERRPVAAPAQCVVLVGHSGIGLDEPYRSAERPRTHSRSGDVRPIEFPDARPGGPNRQERVRRAGAPESLTEAIEEIGMIQVRTCASVHCDQCGDSLGSPGVEEHFATEDAALNTAAAEGWLVGPGGRLWCSTCGPVLTCEAEGHEFSPWRWPVISSGQLAWSEFRHCRRCCLEESRPGRGLIGSHPRQGKSAMSVQLMATDGNGAGEVA